MTSNRLTVYMAGGMRNPWWEAVAYQVREQGGPEFEMLIPAARRNYVKEAQHLEDTEDAYVAWDLWCIQRADLIFAYHEPDNPGGQGLAAEIAYARALGKTVVFADACEHRYMGFARVMANVVVPTMQDGVAVLMTFLVPPLS